jgi:3-oxoacyl-[acyl-carrier protein] reductase
MDLGIRDKVAIVTGSSRGLGFASACALAAEGCRLSLCARTEAPLRAAAGSVAALAGGEERVVAVPADVSMTQGVQAVLDRTLGAFGAIDILVNNVGLGRGSTLLETTDEEWREAIDQTLFPTIWASRQVVPHMQRRGGGVILIVASIYGRESGGRMAYNAVKAAQISLAKSMAQQLAPNGIRVNSVSPGSILFEGGSWWKRQQENPAAIDEFVRREIPFGRFGTAEEVGHVIAFLASPRASWISGASIVVDGGQSRAF